MSDEDTSTFECPKAYPLYPNLSQFQETAMVVVMAVAIGGMTFRLLQFYDAIEKASMGSPPQWWITLVKTWPLLGVLLYLPIGIFEHFGPGANGNACIVPPNGTWGWWYLPGTADFHVMWTGVVEVVGGASLAVGGMLDEKKAWARPLRKGAALVLLVLTVGMTFANFYMVTHGTSLYEQDRPIPSWVQLLRLILQALWLSNLAYMASRDTLGGSGRAGTNKAD